MLYESITLVGVEANRRLSPARSAVKPVTPGSVKILMVGEAGVIGFLAYWIVSEYIFNAYFHDHVDQLLGTHGTTFTAVIGLRLGFAGPGGSATPFKKFQAAKAPLVKVTPPKITRGAHKI